MKAVAVNPGKPGSAHLTDIAEPTLDAVPGGRGVLVRILRVGLDGTDREITAGEYGAAPLVSTTWYSATRASAWWNGSVRR